jgi:hypothetical protein
LLFVTSLSHYRHGLQSLSQSLCQQLAEFNSRQKENIHIY